MDGWMEFNNIPVIQDVVFFFFPSVALGKIAMREMEQLTDRPAPPEGAGWF